MMCYFPLISLYQMTICLNWMMTLQMTTINTFSMQQLLDYQFKQFDEIVYGYCDHCNSGSVRESVEYSNVSQQYRISNVPSIICLKVNRFNDTNTIHSVLYIDVTPYINTTIIRDNYDKYCKVMDYWYIGPHFPHDCFVLICWFLGCNSFEYELISASVYVVSHYWTVFKDVCEEFDRAYIVKMYKEKLNNTSSDTWQDFDISVSRTIAQRTQLIDTECQNLMDCNWYCITNRENNHPA
eukprot:549325_1